MQTKSATRASFSSPVATGNQALAQTDWYIDPENGNDKNRGDDPSSPLKSFAQYLERTGGSYRSLDHRLTFHLVGNVPETDPLAQNITVTASGYVQFFGENLEVLHQGAFSSVRASDLVANTASAIADDTVSNWTPYLNKLVRVTSGPFAAMDACAWVAKNEGGAPVYGRTNKFNYRYDTFNVEGFTPSPGQTYEVVAPRQVGDVNINVIGSNSDRPVLEFKFIRFPPTGEGDFSNSTGSFSAFFGCDFPRLVTSDAHYAGGCLFSGILSITAAGVLTHYFSLIKTFVNSLGGSWVFGGTALVQAAASISYGFNSTSASIVLHSASGGVELYDLAATFFILSNATRHSMVGRIAGKNNTGPFAALRGGSLLVNALSGFNVQTSTNNSGAYGGTSYDATIQGLPTNPAVVQDSNWSYTSSGRYLTYPNLVATYAAGGFAGSARDPFSGTGWIAA